MKEPLLPPEKNKISRLLSGHLCWYLGLAAVLCLLVPYLILGEDVIVTYHDQLDGEMVAYILQARHLFQGDVLPEFMGGMDKTALTLPAPLCVLLFLPGHYFAAYTLMQLFGAITGYLGMYLLGRDITGQKWIGMTAGVLFAYLPFLPVYGLSQYGIPLLLWCFWRLGEKSGPARRRLGCFLYCILYALSSSLVLVGFAVLGGLLAGILFQKRGSRKYPLTAWLCMLTVYVAENRRLLGQIFAGSGSVSHKTEYKIVPEPFLQSWRTYFTAGVQHSEDLHLYILILAAVLLFFAALSRLRGKKTFTEDKALQKYLSLTGWLLGIQLLGSLAAALWDAAPGCALREHLQALKGFQLNRILWVATPLWYLMLICLLGAAARLAGGISASRAGRGALPAPARLLRAAVLVLFAGTVCVMGAHILYKSNLKPNLQKLLDRSYPMISYSDYYALDLMDQVYDYLGQASGEDVSQYRVVSLGIDPAAAYYRGFYCLDGYSNNYSLDYKHSFRRVILPELNKSDYLRQYYDEWGNRCYLFTCECPGYYTIQKEGSYLWQYEIDLASLAGLGGRYLLSAVYLINGEEQGLRLLREEAFETPESYYRIFLYENTLYGQSNS